MVGHVDLWFSGYRQSRGFANLSFLRTLHLRGSHFLIADRAHARRESVESNETGGITLLIDVVFAKGNESFVIERVFALATDDGRGSLEQLECHRSCHSLLGDVHECVVCFTLGCPPPAFIDEICVSRRDGILCGESAAIQHELLQLAVRRVEKSSAWRFVYTA